MTTLYNRWGRESKVWNGFTSKGKPVERNFTISELSPSSYICNGCGREFHAHGKGGVHQGWGFSLSNDSGWLYATNKARATNHAARCKGSAPKRELVGGVIDPELLRYRSDDELRAAVNEFTQDDPPPYDRPKPVLPPYPKPVAP